MKDLKLKIEWQFIDEYNSMCRLKVPGGWLVKVTEEVCHQTGEQGLQSGWDWRVGLAFYPDPEHNWLPLGANEETPQTRLAPCPTCAGLTDQDFVELEGGENGSDWHCSVCKQAVV